MKFEELLKIKKFYWVIFRTTNICNLHCEACNTLDNLPIASNSPYTERRKKWRISLDDVRLFCKVFDGIGDDYENYHRLTGGEFTTLPISYMRKIIDIFYQNQRKMSLITNGYNLLSLGRRYLRKIDHFVLDDHGINHKHIKKCQRYLESWHDGKIKYVKRTYHWNCIQAKNHPYNIGQCLGECHIPQAPALLRGIIYPCPALKYIEMMDKNTKTTEALIQAGWTLNNPDVIDVMRNWRNSIPKYVWNQCLYNCWHPLIRAGTRHKITLKPHDVIHP